MVTVANRTSEARFCTPQPSHALQARRRSPTTETVTQHGSRTGNGLPRLSVVRPQRRLQWLRQKVAEHRKAVVTFIGSSAAVVIAMKEPVTALLPSFAASWMGYAVAAATAYATYRASNAKPVDPEPETDIETDERPVSDSAPRLVWALASFVCVLGGAVLAGRYRGRRSDSVVTYCIHSS